MVPHFAWIVGLSFVPQSDTTWTTPVHAQIVPRIVAITSSRVSGSGGNFSPLLWLLRFIGPFALSNTLYLRFDVLA